MSGSPMRKYAQAAQDLCSNDRGPQQALAADPHAADAWVEALKKLEDKAFYSVQVEKGLKWVQPFIGLHGWAGHVADIKKVIEGS